MTDVNPPTTATDVNPPTTATDVTAPTSEFEDIQKALDKVGEHIAFKYSNVDTTGDRLEADALNALHGVVSWLVTVVANLKRKAGGAP